MKQREDERLCIMWLTREEAAAHLKISLRTLDAWAATGRLVYYRTRFPGERKSIVRYRQRDLDDVLERVEGPAADD
jgi:excisionase family DNA binding protein